MKKYFDIEDVIAESPDTHIFNIIGQGGVGKTYSVKRHVLKEFYERGKKFVYVRRWTTELTQLDTVFTDIESDDKVIQWWECSKWADKYETFHILPFGAWFWLCGEKNDTKIEKLERIGRAISLSKATSFKGGTYNDYSSIIQDECITDEGYVSGDGEAARFDKIVNTVARACNGDVKVFLLGNPDSNIEASPYFKTLNIDYEHIQPNTVYYYDKISPTGRVLANNVCFVKLSGYENTGDGESFLNEYTANIWDTPQGEMRLTGDVVTNRYPQLEKIGTHCIRPVFKIILETPVIAREEYRRKLYIYFGYWHDDNAYCDEPVQIVLKHDNENLDYQVDKSHTLYGRYDRLDIRTRPYKQIYRFMIPRDERYKELRYIMQSVEVNGFLLTDDNRAATLFNTIVTNM